MGGEGEDIDFKLVFRVYYISIGLHLCKMKKNNTVIEYKHKCGKVHFLSWQHAKISHADE